VLTDDIRLRQILINLINNAYKFTESGSITIRLEIISSGTTSLSSSSDELTYRKYNHTDYSKIGQKYIIKFSVIDTGIGIKEKNRNKLFKSFTQLSSSSSGTGLGLVISNQIVSLLGGKIELESKWGLGSCFHFTIGVHEYESSEVHDIMVLVVDDSDYISNILDIYKIKYQLCKSRVEAMVYIFNNEPTIGIINIDLQGNRLAEHIHRSISPFPLIALCKNDDEVVSSKFSRLLKYPNGPQLLEAIKNCLTNNINYNTKILVVEDNKMNKDMLITTLKQIGYKYIEDANNGLEAISIINNTKIDIVLMDINMPKLNGYLAAKKIKRMSDPPKIVAVTGNVLKNDRRRYMQVMDAYICKPIRREKLVSVLSRCST
jgi:CheY-like chemotaxis protein